MSYIQYLTYPELVEVENNLLDTFRRREVLSRDEILRVCREHREVRKLILEIELAEEETTTEINL